MLKKIMGLVLLLFVVCLSNTDSNAQSVKLGVEVGYSSAQGDYGGSTSNFYSGTGYGFNSGISFGGYGKVSLPIGITIKGGLNFTRFSNDGVAETSNANSSVDISNNVLMIYGGPEYSFPVIGSPIKPYIGTNLILSSFTGTVDFQGVSNVPTGSYDIASATRIGVGFDAGAEIKFQSVTLDLNVRYNLLNLIGKEFTDPVLTNNRLASYLQLNDEADPLYSAGSTSHFVSSDRNINTLQVNLGVLFTLGP